MCIRDRPRAKRRLFRELAVTGADGGDLYRVFSPAIRDESLLRGLDSLLKRIEFACCLSYGTLSDPQAVAKTAEEIKMSKQRSYSAVCDIQKSLEGALRDLVRAMDAYATLYLSLIHIYRVFTRSEPPCFPAYCASTTRQWIALLLFFVQLRLHCRPLSLKNRAKTIGRPTIHFLSLIHI